MQYWKKMKNNNKKMKKQQHDFVILKPNFSTKSVSRYCLEAYKFFSTPFD